MIPSESFVRQIKNIDDALSVRFEYWESSAEGGVVTVVPMQSYDGACFTAEPREFPDVGRFVIRERNRINGQHEKVFDAIYPDCTFHPLDNRVIRGIKIRDDIYKEHLATMRDRKEAEAKARRQETIDRINNDGTLPAAFERLYQEDAGLYTYALGAPGAPAASKIGRSADYQEFEKVGPKFKGVPQPPGEMAVRQPEG